MKNKNYVLAVVALVVVMGILLGVYFTTRPNVEAGSKAFTVTVVHKDGTSKVFDYRTDKEYLGPVLAEKGLIVMDDVQSTMFNTVDGETADWSVDGGWWCLYVDGEAAVVGIGEVPIRDGAAYRLEYTTEYVG